MPATATKPKKSGELLSIAKIAMRCGLDRRTTKQRLLMHGYVPEKESATAILYHFDAAVEADLTESADKLNDVRIRKETAAAQKLEMQVKQQMDALVDVSEVEDYLQRLFKALYQEVVTRLPKRIAAQILKSKTPADAAKVLTEHLSRVFDRVREDGNNLAFPTKK